MYIEKKVSGPAVSTVFYEIRQIRFLTQETFVLRLERGDLQFKAGQHIIVGFERRIESAGIFSL